MKYYLCICAAVLLFFSCNTGPTPVKTVMLADVEPFSLGAVNASMDQVLSSGPKAISVEVIFHPRENAVALDFKHETLRYWQFWDEPARQSFIAGLKSYNDDFTNRNLNTNYRKTRKVYGAVKGRLEWHTLSFSAIYQSSPVIELGYRFKGESPYFSTYQNTAKEETAKNQGITESRSFYMYFTRAQGEELAKLFDQAYLIGLVGAITPPPPAVPNRDIY